jgi:hypothetical protein
MMASDVDRPCAILLSHSCSGAVRDSARFVFDRRETTASRHRDAAALRIRVAAHTHGLSRARKWDDSPASGHRGADRKRVLWNARYARKCSRRRLDIPHFECDVSALRERLPRRNRPRSILDIVGFWSRCTADNENQSRYSAREFESPRQSSARSACRLSQRV